MVYLSSFLFKETTMMNGERRFTVYMHVCPNNKKYIGITCQSVKKRWVRGKGYNTNKYFFRAINKYGWDKIDHIIIRDNLSKGKACELEKQLIKKYNTTNQKFGYNHSKGGELSGFGVKHTKAMCRVKSKRQLFEYGGHNVNSKKIKQYSLDGVFMQEFDSMRLAERKTGVFNSNISLACKNKVLQAGGYIWRYYQDHNVEVIVNKIKNKREASGYKGAKRVNKLSLHKEFIEQYNSAQLAAEQNNTKASNISNACNGVQKTCAGFIWEYTDKEKTNE